ncbi:MAG TPA: alanine dehydrogenase [Vicinamibacteria bacterium]|nr:alanine dehydrogenase [Vicinamibacteria bacterium]
MDIGIPKEMQSREHRVSLTPSGVKVLVQLGHRVWVETGAGFDAGHPDADYQSAGATTAFSRMEVFARAELLSGVQAPLPHEYELLQPRQVVVAFWALPASRPEDLAALQARELTAVGLEVIEDEQGRAPVLTSMSELAGGLAVTVGAGLLLNELGGKGILLGGCPGVPSAHLVILGAGALGRAAARVAIGAGAEVTLLDRSVDHLRDAIREVGRPVTTMLATRPNIEKALSFADLVLGAVAVHGQRAPILVTREMLRLMKPRTVVMDLSIDMGGCFETARPTSFPTPVYEVDGILHFCVPNLPSVAARSATLALTNALLPYLTEVAGRGFERAIVSLPDLGRGTYLYRGRCTRESLARAFGIPHQPLPSAEVG